MTDPQTQTTVETADQKADREEEEESLWQLTAAAAEAGETPDSATRDILGLAHRAIERFPELAGRYRRFAGPAAVVSGALVALAGVAIARRVRRGELPDRILEELTPAEIESAAQVADQEHRRSLREFLRRRKKKQERQAASRKGG